MLAPLVVSSGVQCVCSAQLMRMKAREPGTSRCDHVPHVAHILSGLSFVAFYWLLWRHLSPDCAWPRSFLRGVLTPLWASMVVSVGLKAALFRPLVPLRELDRLMRRIVAGRTADGRYACDPFRCAYV